MLNLGITIVSSRKSMALAPGEGKEEMGRMNEAIIVVRAIARM
jgi:hypothetical protein